MEHAQFIICGVVWTVGLLCAPSPFLRPSGRLSLVTLELSRRVFIINVLYCGRNLDVLLGLLALAWLFRDAEGLGHDIIGIVIVVDVARCRSLLVTAPHMTRTAAVDVH